MKGKQLLMVEVSDKVFTQLCLLLEDRHSCITTRLSNHDRSVTAQLDGGFVGDVFRQGKFAFKARPVPQNQWRVVYDPEVVNFGLAQDNPEKASG